MSYNLEQIQSAWHNQNPNLIEMMQALCYQPDPLPTAPIPEDELTFERFLSLIFSPSFRAQDPEVQFAKRVAMLAELEADLGVYPLPDRFKIHIILLGMWQDWQQGNEFARAILKQALDELPLNYGVWKAIKAIFKEAERSNDYEIFALIAAKIDSERFTQYGPSPVSKATKTYMSLRAWRYLRTLGEQAAVFYPQAAVAVLAAYPENLTAASPLRQQSWVLNHICFHNSVSYGVNRFSADKKRQLFDATGRAFAHAWQRDPTPLIDLICLARSEAIRQFATDSLKHDFKTQLREVSVSTIQRIAAIQTSSPARDQLIVWLISQSPNFEQAKFVQLGLHDIVLRLLYSSTSEAFEYAISYAKTYAKALPLNMLLFLAESKQAPVRQYAMTQILSRHPRNDIGIEIWGQLLDSDHHHSTAIKVLKEHFTKKELTPDWLATRLVGGNLHSTKFAIDTLSTLYSAKALGMDFFLSLIPKLNEENNKSQYAAMTFILKQLKELGADSIPVDTMQLLLVHPMAQETVVQWIYSNLLTPSRLPMSYWHSLAYEPDWQKSQWVQQLTSAKQGETDSWQQHLAFDEMLAADVKNWLSDVRMFATPDLGFDWLLKLAQTPNDSIQDFAIRCINKGFLPADFAALSKASTETEAETETENRPNTTADNLTTDTTITVNLEGKSYLFTGKLSSMSRSEAENMVVKAGGVINKSVNNNLDFLVIGDEGSPLYGNGRKGSKQVKAEALIASGSHMVIISETAFLQKLSGKSREADEDKTLQGAEVLWHMATDDPSAPISSLAIHYLSHHHKDLCMELSDRPVDPQAVIPAEFFSADRLIPLMVQGNQALRDFALAISKYEMNRWHITPAQWVAMAQSEHQDVKQRLTEALLSKRSSKNHRFHQSVDRLSADMCYALIDSNKYFARQLGISLLNRYPQFQIPQALYHLTQSQDREVRFAAVTLLWKQFRAQQTPKTWSPNRHVGSDSLIDSGSTNTTDTKAVDKTTTAYRAEDSREFLTQVQPASLNLEELLTLLKRGLYELPPARLYTDADKKQSSQHAKQTHSNQYSKDQRATTSRPAPIPASRAKLALIETYRDVALEDRDFAELVLPVLHTFTGSAAKMERHACLVAVTRIWQAHPALRPSA